MKPKEELNKEQKQKNYFKSQNTNSKGITLIALIITIVILLILAVVTISAVQGDGIIGHAKNAKTAYVEAQEKEQIALALEEWKITKEQAGAPTFEEFLKGKFGDDNVTEKDDKWTVTFPKTSNKYDIEGEHALKIGNFVKYNVSYTDMYNSKEYTAENGWRYLGTDNAGNNLIISTGIPAVLCPSCGDETNSTWWVQDEKTLGEFKELLKSDGHIEFYDNSCRIYVSQNFGWIVLQFW